MLLNQCPPKGSSWHVRTSKIQISLSGQHEELDDRDGDGEEAQPSAIILRSDLATYCAITE